MLSHTIQRLKFEYSSLVAREPLLAPFYWPNIWWQQYKIWRYYREHGASLTECFVNRNTEFVLDGFQGSANSFAADAFQASQRRKVKMAHHMHAPAQIIKATKRHKPTLVTIRDPKGSVLSLTSRWPYVTVQQALRSYIGFYEKIEPYRDGYVLSPFHITIKHLDVAVQAVNTRFETGFDLVSDQSIAVMRDEHGPNEIAQKKKKDRSVLKAKKEAELQSADSQELLQAAKGLYERMTGHPETLSLKEQAS